MTRSASRPTRPAHASEAKMRTRKTFIVLSIFNFVCYHCLPVPIDEESSDGVSFFSIDDVDEVVAVGARASAVPEHFAVGKRFLHESRNERLSFGLGRCFDTRLFVGKGTHF